MPLADLLSDDGQLQDIELQTKAAVLTGNIASKITVLEEQLLPVERLGARLLPAAAGLWREVSMPGNEGTHLGLQGPVFFGVGQLHWATQ